ATGWISDWPAARGPPAPPEIAKWQGITVDLAPEDGPRRPAALSMPQDLLDRIRNCSHLPSLPTVALEVLRLTQQDSVDLNEIAKAISVDPALAAKLLRTANSSYHGRTQRIGTLRLAASYLGIKAVRTLCLGFSLVSDLITRRPQSFDHITYWRRSIY